MWIVIIKVIRKPKVRKLGVKERRGRARYVRIVYR